MAIVFKYGNPGSILQTGFAAGIGQRQKDQQKSLLDVWQQNQSTEQQALSRQQQAALQQQSQEFQAGQNDANRLSRQFEDTAQRNFAAGQADLNRRQGQMDDQRRFNQLEYFKLPPIPEHADASVRKMLTEKRSALGELLGKTWDHSDPNVQKAFREAHDAYTSGISALPPPPSNITHFDSQGNEFDQPVPGMTTPYDKKTLKALENPQQEAAQKLAEEQKKEQAKLAEAQQKKLEADKEKAAAELKKEQDAIVADAKKLASEKNEDATPKYKSFDEALAEAASNHKKAKDFFSGTATPPPQQAPPQQSSEVTQAQSVPEITPELIQRMVEQGVPKAFTDSLTKSLAEKSQQSSYTPEMRKEIQEKSALPKPQSEEEYNAIPSGATYVYIDGTIKRKP